MGTTSLIVAIVIVVVVLALLGLAAVFYSEERRTRRLREHFGPEYNHAVEIAGGRKQAELDLRSRVQQHDSLSVQPVAADQRDRYTQEWRQVQASFVDTPGTALGQADSLVTRVMLTRGYPVEDFEERADLVSVDHPQVVVHYRQAHEVYRAGQVGPVSTEEVRRAFVSYRLLFSELVQDGRTETMADGPTEVTSTGGGPAAAQSR
jgi:hypothetical protein